MYLRTLGCTQLAFKCQGLNVELGLVESVTRIQLGTVGYTRTCSELVLSHVKCLHSRRRLLAVLFLINFGILGIGKSASNYDFCTSDICSEPKSLSLVLRPRGVPARSLRLSIATLITYLAEAATT
jgi:hypothetical protein